MRRRDLCLAALASLCLAAPAASLAQEGDAMPPGEAASLRDRMDGLEAEVELLRGQEFDSYLAIVVSSVAGLTAGAHSAYLVEWLSRHRLRPILAWTAFGDGLRIVRSDLPDGTTVLTARITNVGQVAALDILNRVRVRMSGSVWPGATRRIQPDAAGSLHPGASTDIQVRLSGDESGWIRGGRKVTFEIEMWYRTVNNRTYYYRVAGLHSEGMGELETRSRSGRGRRRPGA